LAVRLDDDARTLLRLYRAGPGRSALRPLPLPALPAGTLGNEEPAFSPDGRRLAVYLESGRSPRDLYVADLARRTVRRLTHALGPEVRAAALVEAQSVRFRSFDGVEIPGLLDLPRPAPAPDGAPLEKLPAILYVHGGPGDQTRAGYFALAQFFVNHGYAFYAINHRGSSGYGKRFLALARRRHGEDDLDDCVAAN